MRYLILFIISFSITACNQQKSGNSGGNSGLDSFNQDNLYADLFSLTKENNYTILSVRNPWQGGGQELLRYYIASKQDTLPGDVLPKNIIRTPIYRVVCLSTTHIAMIEMLGESDGIVGVSGTDYVSSSSVRARISLGLVKDIGYDSNINNELIATLKPDLVIAHGIGAESAGYMSKLEEAEIPVLFIADYLEEHPLAKAEWIKVFGLIYGKESEANQYFLKIAGEYEVMSQEINSRISSKPVVMTGLPYKDSWFVSPGNSFLSKIIADAGGKYLWEDIESDMSIPMSLESVYIKAMEADIWLNSGSAQSINEIISLDSRLADLPPVKNGTVFNNIKRLGAHGGNDYWESGSLSPHTILMDIASIIHPEFFPAYDPCYYIRLQ